jgi:hypothetical protein
MNRLEPGNRIKLFGGYDMDPPWLREHDSFHATVLKFFDNEIENRKGDERLSAVIQFDDPVTFDGLEGKYGVILGRWEGQKWEKKGVVHVHLLDREISGPSEITKDNSRWMESHASYECIDD